MIIRLVIKVQRFRSEQIDLYLCRRAESHIVGAKAKNGIHRVAMREFRSILRQVDIADRELISKINEIKIMVMTMIYDEPVGSSVQRNHPRYKQGLLGGEKREKSAGDNLKLQTGGERN